MRSYITKHYKGTDMVKKIFGSLPSAPDPAKLVLDVIQSFYELLEPENDLRQVSCVALSGALMKIKANVTPQLKDDAIKFSIMWRGSFTKQSYTHPTEIFSFLHFLASYKLAKSFDADELLSLVGIFYTESEVCMPEHDSYLFRILGLKKKIPGNLKLHPGITKLTALILIDTPCVKKKKKKPH